jgi:hypothetical protein
MWAPFHAGPRVQLLFLGEVLLRRQRPWGSLRTRRHLCP